MSKESQRSPSPGSGGRSVDLPLVDTIGDAPPVQAAYSVFDRLLHIHETPLKNLRQSYWWIRKTFFTRPRTPTPSYLVDLDKPAALEVLGQRHFEPGWTFSYNYHGEVLNVRRGEYVDGEYTWWQTHVRGYDHPEGIELTAHYETDPAEHPDAHIDLHGLDVDHGMAEIKQILDERGVEYQRLAPEERPGIGEESVVEAKRPN